MVQNREIEAKPLTNGDVKDEDGEKEKELNGDENVNGHVSDYEESDDDDYLDHLLMLPPLDRDSCDRNKNLVSKTLLDFCAAIEGKKEYQKIKQELRLNAEQAEDKAKEVSEPIVNGKQKQATPAPVVERKIVSKPRKKNEVTIEESLNVPEIRRQSIRLKRAMFVPEHEPSINDQFFVCRRCTIFFRTRKLRKEHNLLNHRRKAIADVTGKDVTKRRRTSANKEPFVCDLCQKLFKQKALLRSHMNSHQTEPQFFCTLCPYASKRNNDLKKHYLTHHDPLRVVQRRLRKRKCDHCEDVLDGKKAFKLHMREKHPPVKKTRVFQKTCEKCEEVLVGMKVFRLHMKQKHSESRDLRCETCHRRFKSNFRLKKHKLKYAEAGTTCRTYFRPNGIEATFGCEQCDKKFLLKSHLALHQKKHVSLTCEKCNQTFKNKFNLKWHEFSHLEIDPKCSNCAVSFTSEQKFAVHLKKKVCTTNAVAVTNGIAT